MRSIAALKQDYIRIKKEVDELQNEVNILGKTSTEHWRLINKKTELQNAKMRLQQTHNQLEAYGITDTSAQHEHATQISPEVASKQPSVAPIRRRADPQKMGPQTLLIPHPAMLNVVGKVDVRRETNRCRKTPYAAGSATRLVRTASILRKNRRC